MFLFIFRTFLNNAEILFAFPFSLATEAPWADMFWELLKIIPTLFLHDKW